jgi:hypothetical protein
MGETENQGVPTEGSPTDKVDLVKASSHTERREDFTPSVGLTTEGKAPSI